MNTLSEFSQLTLDIYRMANCIKPEQFRGNIFDRLQKFIEFDSAVWIQAILVEDIPTTQNVYLHNQPDYILEEYAKWNTDDVILETILCNPGQCFLWRDLEDQELRRKTEMYLNYESKFGLEDGISIMIPFCDSGIQTFLSLYRSQIDKPFTSVDCERFQAIAPHLVEADNAVTTSDIRHTYDFSQIEHSVAIINHDGYLNMAEIGFIDCLSKGWPNWNPPQIPAELLAYIEKNTEIGEVINEHFVCAKRTDDGFVLSIRLVRPIDHLTLREQQIALKIADGMPYKAVAKELNISTSTVTNHINSVHSKLGVSTRAELSKIIRY